MSKRNNIIGYSSQSYRFLLDEVPNAKIAYSVYRLDSSYAGNCALKSDGVTNIGFVDNLIDVASIVAADETIRRWYDQVGFSDAFQNTAAAFPRIKNGGVVDTLNGVPALRFDGSNDRLVGVNNIFRNTTQGFIACVVNRDTNIASEAIPFQVATATPNTRAAISYRNATAGNQGLSAAGRRLAANSFQAVGTSAYTGNQIIVCAYFDWGNARLRIWENGVLTGDLNPFQTAGATENNAGNYALGSAATGASNFLNGHIQELVVWEDADAVNAFNNLSTVFSNINSRFNTY